MAETNGNGDKAFLRRHIIGVMFSVILVLGGSLWAIEKWITSSQIEVLETKQEIMSDSLAVHSAILIAMNARAEQDAELRKLLLQFLQKQGANHEGN